MISNKIENQTKDTIIMLLPAVIIQYVTITHKSNIPSIQMLCLSSSDDIERGLLILLLN